MEALQQGGSGIRTYKEINRERLTKAVGCITEYSTAAQITTIKASRLYMRLQVMIDGCLSFIFTSTVLALHTIAFSSQDDSCKYPCF